MDQESADYVAITRLQARYADVVTRRAWPELSEIFVSGIEVEIDAKRGEPLHLQGPDGVGEFISNAIAHLDLFEFVILNTVIDIVGDTATGRMYIWEIRHDPTSGRTDAYGVYRDAYERVDGRWWFTNRRYQSMARTLPTQNAVFALPVDLAE